MPVPSVRDRGLGVGVDGQWLPPLRRREIGVTPPSLPLQAIRWGAECLMEDVEELDLSVRPFLVRGTETEVRAQSVIVATGATARRLGIPSEHEFWSRGISACAICDGASPIFKGQVVAVVGGGDTATEEAIYLTKYAKHVHLLVRGDRMRASKAMQERVLANKDITVHFNTGVADAIKDSKGRMSGLQLVDTRTNDKTVELECRGLFYGIGHKPNSDFLRGQVETDESGYIALKEGPMTSVAGVFAAGDICDHEWRQAITAAGSGCQAAIAVERYLTANNLVVEAGAKVAQAAAEAAAAAARPAVEHHAAAAPSKPSPEPAKSAKKAATTEADFDIHQSRFKGQYALRRLYHESDRLLAVLYSSPTCGPCRTLKPIFNKVVDEYPGKIHYVEIDIVDDPEIAEAAGVMGSPTIQFFYQKELVKSTAGVKMKSDYRKIIESVIGDRAKVEA